MTRTSFFSLFLSLVFFLPACQSGETEETSAPQRPNIIFIFSDDHALDAISAYGATRNETPNIDRLAQQGMLFRHAMVTNSICAPSRAVIQTGKHSHLNGVLDNRLEFDSSQVTFPKLLQKANYETAMIGKWHLKSEPVGFDYWRVLPGQGHYYNPDFRTPEGKEQIEGYVTDIVTDLSINWLKEREDSDQPFLLMTQHKAPHREWSPSPAHLGMYDDTKFPEPDNLFDTHEGRSPAASMAEMSLAEHMHIQYDNKIHTLADSSIDSWLHRAPFFLRARMTEEQLADWDSVYDPKIESFQQANLSGDDLTRWKYQRYMEDYLGTIASLDDNIGRLLDYLDESGMAENTLVIYSSDQGFYLGEHGWYDKRWMYEESLHMPFIARWPGVIEAGTENTDLVQNLDYAETFLDIAGANIPAEMQGRSILPLLKGETPNDWRDAVYYHYHEYPAVHMVNKHYGVRTERYKLIRFYELDAWELYDLQTDPKEMTNLYGQEGYEEITASLKQRLEELKTEAQDPVEG
ncbi:MAG: sulfatase [Bacteroidota bacterium]